MSFSFRGSNSSPLGVWTVWTNGTGADFRTKCCGVGCRSSFSDQADYSRWCLTFGSNKPAQKCGTATLDGMPTQKQLALVKCQTGKSKLRPQLRWAIDTPKKQSTDGTGYRWETNYRLHFFAGWDVEMNIPAIKEGLIFCISCSLHNHGNSYIRGSNSQQMGWISMGEYLIECASLPAGMIW